MRDRKSAERRRHSAPLIFGKPEGSDNGISWQGSGFPAGWMEAELTAHLAPVHAPDELWRRVATGKPARRGRLAFAAPIAAVVTLVVAGAIWFSARGQQSSAAFRVPVQARAEACMLCHTTM